MFDLEERTLQVLTHTTETWAARLKWVISIGDISAFSPLPSPPPHSPTLFSCPLIFPTLISPPLPNTPHHSPPLPTITHHSSSLPNTSTPFLPLSLTPPSSISLDRKSTRL